MYDISGTSLLIVVGANGLNESSNFSQRAHYYIDFVMRILSVANPVTDGRSCF